MIRIVHAIAALVAAAATVIVATPALAASDVQSIAVPTAGLDLSTPGGRALLRARVGRAANKVCAGHDARGVAAHRAFITCRDAAIRGALGD